jgi:hypothetical protein
MPSVTHSIPQDLSSPTTPALPPSSFSAPRTDPSGVQSGERASAAADFSHSWDLATGGFKTLTAKRELPPRQEKRASASLPPAPARSYMFLLVILACVVVMLISGGIVLFITLQP